MKKCYVPSYNPIREYGGWSYHGSFGKGKVLNVKGNKGIQLEFKDGKKILIGTQKQEDIHNLIEQYFKTNDEYKKAFALRLNEEILNSIEKWASDEFRSTNGQIEWMLQKSLKEAKREPKKKTD